MNSRAALPWQVYLVITVVAMFALGFALLFAQALLITILVGIIAIYVLSIGTTPSTIAGIILIIAALIFYLLATGAGGLALSIGGYPLMESFRSSINALVTG